MPFITIATINRDLSVEQISIPSKFLAVVSRWMRFDPFLDQWITSDARSLLLNLPGAFVVKA